MSVYISIEKSVERFEKYRALWEKRGITGILTTTMTEGNIGSHLQAMSLS